MIPDLDELAPAIGARDVGAFAKWIAAAEPCLRRALAGTARCVDVEAVVQETLLRVWQIAPAFKSDGRPNGLLRLSCRIARNVAITEFRRRHPARELPVDLEGPEWSGDWSVDADGLGGAIRECLERLPAAPRLAIEARLRGRTDRDDVLAGSLGMKINTFFQNIRRARLALVNCLRKRGFEPEYDG
jgi:RNA polymerase sigma-70 factor (ECF subfamily)